MHDPGAARAPIREGERDSLIASSDEMFVEARRKPGDGIALPDPNIKPP